MLQVYFVLNTAHVSECRSSLGTHPKHLAIESIMTVMRVQACTAQGSGASSGDVPARPAAGLP